MVYRSTMLCNQVKMDTFPIPNTRHILYQNHGHVKCDVCQKQTLPDVGYTSYHKQD